MSEEKQGGPTWGIGECRFKIQETCYGRSVGLKTVISRTRSKSASLLARKERPYSRMAATIIESLVRSPASCRTDCAFLIIVSFTGMKRRLRANILWVLSQ